MRGLYKSLKQDEPTKSEELPKTSFLWEFFKGTDTEGAQLDSYLALLAEEENKTKFDEYLNSLSYVNRKQPYSVSEKSAAALQIRTWLNKFSIAAYSKPNAKTSLELVLGVFNEFKIAIYDEFNLFKSEFDPRHEIGSFGWLKLFKTYLLYFRDFLFDYNNNYFQLVFLDSEGKKNKACGLGEIFNENLLQDSSGNVTSEGGIFLTKLKQIREPKVSPFKNAVSIKFSPVKNAISQTFKALLGEENKSPVDFKFLTQEAADLELQEAKETLKALREEERRKKEAEQRKIAEKDSFLLDVKDSILKLLNDSNNKGDPENKLGALLKDLASNSIEVNFGKNGKAAFDSVLKQVLAKFTLFKTERKDSITLENSIALFQLFLKAYSASLVEANLKAFQELFTQEFSSADPLAIRKHLNILFPESKAAVWEQPQSLEAMKNFFNKNKEIPGKPDESPLGGSFTEENMNRWNVDFCLAFNQDVKVGDFSFSKATVPFLGTQERAVELFKSCKSEYELTNKTLKPHRFWIKRVRAFLEKYASSFSKLNKNYDYETVFLDVLEIHIPKSGADTDTTKAIWKVLDPTRYKKMDDSDWNTEKSQADKKAKREAGLGRAALLIGSVQKLNLDTIDKFLIEEFIVKLATESLKKGGAIGDIELVIEPFYPVSFKSTFKNLNDQERGNLVFSLLLVSNCLKLPINNLAKDASNQDINSLNLQHLKNPKIQGKLAAEIDLLIKGLILKEIITEQEKSVQENKIPQQYRQKQKKGIKKGKGVATILGSDDAGEGSILSSPTLKGFSGNSATTTIGSPNVVKKNDEPVIQSVPEKKKIIFPPHYDEHAQNEILMKKPFPKLDPRRFFDGKTADDVNDDKISGPHLKKMQAAIKNKFYRNYRPGEVNIQKDIKIRKVAFTSDVNQLLNEKWDQFVDFWGRYLEKQKDMAPAHDSDCIRKLFMGFIFEAMPFDFEATGLLDVVSLLFFDLEKLLSKQSNFPDSVSFRNWKPNFECTFDDEFTLLEAKVAGTSISLLPVEDASTLVMFPSHFGPFAVDAIINKNPKLLMQEELKDGGSSAEKQFFNYVKTFFEVRSLLLSQENDKTKEDAADRSRSFKILDKRINKFETQFAEFNNGEIQAESLGKKFSLFLNEQWKPFLDFLVKYRSTQSIFPMTGANIGSLFWAYLLPLDRPVTYSTENYLKSPLKHMFSENTLHWIVGALPKDFESMKELCDKKPVFEATFSKKFTLDDLRCGFEYSKGYVCYNEVKLTDVDIESLNLEFIEGMPVEVIKFENEYSNNLVESLEPVFLELRKNRTLSLINFLTSPDEFTRGNIFKFIQKINVEAQTNDGKSKTITTWFSKERFNQEFELQEGIWIPGVDNNGDGRLEVEKFKLFSKEKTQLVYRLIYLKKETEEFRDAFKQESDRYKDLNLFLNELDILLKGLNPEWKIKIDDQTKCIDQHRLIKKTSINLMVKGLETLEDTFKGLIEQKDYKEKPNESDRSVSEEAPSVVAVDVNQNEDLNEKPITHVEVINNAIKEVWLKSAKLIADHFANCKNEEDLSIAKENFAPTARPKFQEVIGKHQILKEFEGLEDKLWWIVKNVGLIASMLIGVGEYIVSKRHQQGLPTFFQPRRAEKISKALNEDVVSSIRNTPVG